MKSKERKPRKLCKPRVFYSSAESVRELLYLMDTVVQCNSPAQVVEFLEECKAEPIEKTGSPPEYWDRIKIFKVTVEEIAR